MRVVLRIGTVMAIGALASSIGLACGDKYLVPGRGMRFQRTPSERQLATVLFYAPPTSALARTLEQLKAETALRRAGYRPTVVTSAEALPRSAATSWDVVLVDAADGAAVKDQISSASRAHMVAVIAAGTAVQATLARREFQMVLKAPTRNQDLLDALDEAAARTFDEHARAAKGR
jgi:hypothetical protein